MDIIPFQSIGILSFGDSRQAARDKLACCFSTFVKDVGANETDSFDERGLHLYFDDEGRLEFVEAFNPAEVTFRGIHFLGRELQSVVEDMIAIGFSPSESDIGVDFADAGIALTAPYGVVEGIASHRKGYYD
jgi:hypothetical protein